MATNEWDDVNRPLPGPLPTPSRVPPLSTLYDKATTGTSAATDVARTLIGGPVAAIGGAWQSPLQALSAGPGYLYRKYAEGDTQGADEYWKQNVKPAEENMYNLYKKLAEPSTKQGKQFEEDFAAALDASKLPPVFPGLTSGIPVRGITPTDVRVMGANAKRIGTQVRDIPTDFRNAQSGLQRIDPVTGKPTLGAKLQSTAESVGDTLERQADARTARTDTAGMSPLSAASAALMPDTSMNVMRPVDSRILRAKTPEGAASLAIPASATGSRGDISRLDPLSTELNKHTLTYDEMMKPHPLLSTYMAQYARDNNAVHDAGIDAALAQRALEKFPDAPSPSEAILALEAFHGGPTSEGMAKEHMAAADAYAKSPAAAAAATQPGVTPIPTSEEFLRRYEASEKWRTNNFPAFVTKYLGTETDPALSLASQGFTFQDPEHVLWAGENSVRTAVKNRIAAGMPEKTALQTALEAKENELAQKDTQWRAIEDTREARTFSKNNIVPLQKEIENLKLGAAYENMADAAVIPTKVQDMLGAMDYSATQFFPSLTGESNPAAIVYKLEKAAIARLGFDDIVDQMHQDILNGKYDPDKVKNISVDRYIRENAEARQNADAAVQALQQAYIKKVGERFEGMAKDLPADALKYENAYILESTKDTPVDEVIQRASDDSGVLDNCIGKGSDASQSGKQPKHPFTGLAGTHYEPVFLLDQPGVRNPKAAQNSSTFTRRVHTGENILSHVRDETTGFPVANIELKMHRRRDGTQGYTLGYVSGPTTTDGTNGPIDPKYHNAIRDYLNRYADKIGSVDMPLVENTTIRDTLSGEYDSIGVEAGYRDNKDLRAAYPDLPRFITLDDARAIRNGTYQMPESAQRAAPAARQAAVPAAVSPEVLREQIANFTDTLLDELERAHGEGFADDVAQILAPLVDRHDYSLGLGPLINQIDRVGNTQSDEIAADLMDFAQYLREEQHIPPGPAVAPAALGAFAPEAPHPAGPGGVQDIAHHLLEIERRPDGTLSTEGLASTAYALLHGQLDYPGYTHIPPGPERARAMRPILDIFANAAENAIGFPLSAPEVAPEPAPAPAPEPEPAPVAQFSPVPRHIQNETTDVLLRALDDPAAVNNVIDIATRYIQGNTPEDLAVLPQLIRTTNVGLHQTMGMISRELLARQIEDRHPQQAQEQNLLRAPYNELQQVITPIERTLVTSMQTRIARSASDYGVSGTEVADMIRRRSQTYGGLTVNLDGLSSQALEVLARDTSDSIEAQNRARDRRPRQ